MLLGARGEVPVRCGFEDDDIVKARNAVQDRPDSGHRRSRKPKRQIGGHCEPSFSTPREPRGGALQVGSTGACGLDRQSPISRPPNNSNVAHRFLGTRRGQTAHARSPPEGGSFFGGPLPSNGYKLRVRQFRFPTLAANLAVKVG